MDVTSRTPGTTVDASAAFTTLNGLNAPAATTLAVTALPLLSCVTGVVATPSGTGEVWSVATGTGARTQHQAADLGRRVAAARPRGRRPGRRQATA
ncbi:MAG: hypothetical protein ACRYG2_36605 [Janthinobacterium lividum]